MSIRVGMPTMFLGRQKGVQGKRTGNARAVLCECLQERYSSDTDLDRSKTKDNIYLTGVTSGHALADEWESRAENYTQVQKNGRERNLRADAHIGFTGICKPAMDSEYSSYPRGKQIRFCRDSFSVLQQLYAKYGITLDFGVIHLDEANAHLHYGGHDEDFRLAKRIKLKLFNDLNKGEYVRQMQAKGWDIQPLEGYDAAAAAQMTDEEREQYKAEQIERKRAKKGGKSSKQYKAEQDAKKIVQDAQEQAQEIQAQLEQQKRIQDERETQLYAPVEPVKTNLFGGVKNAADIINAQQEQIKVLQARSDRKTIYDGDLQAASKARKAAERDRRAAAADRTAAQAEKEKYTTLIAQQEQKIQQEVDKRVPAAARKLYNFNTSVMSDFINANPKRAANFEKYRADAIQQRQDIPQVSQDISHQMQDDTQYD